MSASTLKTISIALLLMWLGGISHGAQPEPSLLTIEGRPESAAQSAAKPGNSGLAFAVVVNKSNSIETLAFQDLRRLLLGEVQRWPGKQKVTLTRQKSDNKRYWLAVELILRMTPIEYVRHLAQSEFLGEGVVPMKVLDSDSGILEYVATVPGAVGIVDADVAATSPLVKTVKISGRLSRSRP